jgi:hypothetical protein
MSGLHLNRPSPDGPIPPQFVGTAPADLQERLSLLLSQIPTGPIGSGTGATVQASERGAWAADESLGGQLTVSVPRNLEAFADDFQAIAGVAALAALPGVQVVASSSDWPLTQRLSTTNKAAAQYFGGIAHALSHASSVNGQDYTGNFGHGVAFVTHTWAATNNLEPWLIKGTAKSPQQVLTSQAWATGLPTELRRLDALIRRAAKVLPLKDNIARWSKTFSQLAGHGIKQAVPYKKVGVVSQAEVDWISVTNQRGESLFKKLKDDLTPSKVTYATLRDLPERNREIAAAFRSASEMHDSATRGRFGVLNGKLNRRDLTREAKKPIAERLANMDTIDKWSVMHPLFLRGRKFALAEDQITGIRAGNPAVYGSVERAIVRFTESEPDPSLKRMAQTWFGDALASLNQNEE